MPDLSIAQTHTVRTEFPRIAREIERGMSAPYEYEGNLDPADATLVYAIGRLNDLDCIVTFAPRNVRVQVGLWKSYTVPIDRESADIDPIYARNSALARALHDLAAQTFALSEL